MEASSDEFVSLLTRSQPAIYSCILALLPDRVAAQDILQETNLTLWHKREEFEPGTSFVAWAARIAKYHILNYRRRLSRDRLIFDDELFESLSVRLTERAHELSGYAEPLRKCLGQLSQEHRDLLAARYGVGGSVKRVAELRGQGVGAVSQMLYRIRESLLNCVLQQLKSGDL